MTEPTRRRCSGQPPRSGHSSDAGGSHSTRRRISMNSPTPCLVNWHKAGRLTGKIFRENWHAQTVNESSY